jgi:transcriptional regulator with XRE-family HTH domain
MNWKKLISELASAGVTQTQIADACGVKQSSVSDLHRGATKSPSFEFGNKLIALHKERVKPPSGRPARERAAAAEIRREVDRIFFGASKPPGSKPSNRRER